jgi:hypothetical protein
MDTSFPKGERLANKKRFVNFISNFFILNVFCQNTERNNLFETENILLTNYFVQVFGYYKFNHFWIS